MPDPPTGTVTFLFTDIEGSTKLWEQQPQQMKTALAHHDALLRQTIQAHHGHVFKTVGDAFCAAFETAQDALAAALAIQHALVQEGEKGRRGEGEQEPLSPPLPLSPSPPLSLRVRIALHTGVAEERDNDYFGPTLNRVARLLSIGHGEQVLLSQSTERLLPGNLPKACSLRDMGMHRLKDLQAPEQVFQLLHPALREAFPPLKSLDYLPNNLPLNLTSFIGRAREMEEVHRLLNTAPLVTLTGAGGCGKTRLALQVAADRLEEFSDGVFLVELAALTEGRLVPQQVASALSLREEPGRTLTQTLCDYLKSKPLLLLLDNGEHLVEACAELADTLLSVCPHLKILVTSRRPLGIGRETVWRVPSLGLPDLTPQPPSPSASSGQALLARTSRGKGEPNPQVSAFEPNVSERTTFGEEESSRATGSPFPSSALRPRSSGKGAGGLGDLAHCDSIRLFTERARQARTDFMLTETNTAAIAQVCVRLDGIPLAIELAAARVRAMSAEQIAQRLHDRFRLLTGGSRTAPTRQQTLRATMDWSYDLLTEEERLLLRRLSVFAGGWTLEAAESVCSGESIEAWEVLDLLTKLVDKSLVMFDETAGEEGRYRLLETVRQYGLERLTETGEGDVLRVRHRDFFLRWAEEAMPHLVAHEQAAWFDRLQTEYDNLRSALEWCKTEAGGAESALRLVPALQLFWETRGHLGEGRAYFANLLARADMSEKTVVRARALNGAGLLAFRQGDFVVARALLAESLEIVRELGNMDAMTTLLGHLGMVASNQGDFDEARALLEECLTIAQALGDKQKTAMYLNNLGNMIRTQGDYETARIYFEEALPLSREVGNKRLIAMLLTNLGIVRRRQGDHAAARALHEESLAIERALNNKIGIANTLNSLALVASEEGDPMAARAFHEEALAIYEEIGNRWGIAHALNNLGNLALAQGDYATARTLHEECLTMRRETGDKPGIAMSFIGLGGVAVKQSDYAAARTLYGEALARYQELEDRPGIAMAIEGFMSLAVSIAEPERAVCLFGAVLGLREAIGAPLPPLEQAGYESEFAPMRVMLGGEAYAAVWEEGRKMTMEQAIAYALEEAER